jgi:GTP-dependent phosphoenolpyruvate carboxykinase
LDFYIFKNNGLLVDGGVWWTSVDMGSADPLSAKDSNWVIRASPKSSRKSRFSPCYSGFFVF